MKNNRLIYLLLAILLIWNVIITTNYINEEDAKVNVIETNVSGYSTDLTKVVDKVKSSVCTINTNEGISSGLIYSKNNDSIYVLTTAHSINKSSNIKVILPSYKEVGATLVNLDNKADIAVLEINQNIEINEINIGDSALLSDGEFLITIGTPNDLEYAGSVNLALVSSKLRSISNSITVDRVTHHYINNYIQLDSNVTNGNSGSPVFNMNGDVVGMILMKDETAVFALPIDEIVHIADNIIENNEYVKIDLGISGLFISDLENYQKNNLNIALDVNHGYLINSVLNKSLANTFGLKQGDIILDINDIEIYTNNDLLNFEYSNTKEIVMNIIRNNETITINGTIDD